MCQVHNEQDLSGANSLFLHVEHFLTLYSMHRVPKIFVCVCGRRRGGWWGAGGNGRLLRFEPPEQCWLAKIWLSFTSGIEQDQHSWLPTINSCQWWAWLVLTICILLTELLGACSTWRQWVWQSHLPGELPAPSPQHSHTTPPQARPNFCKDLATKCQWTFPSM